MRFLKKIDWMKWTLQRNLFPCTCNATHKKCQIYVNENIPTFLDFYNEVSMYTT